MKAWLILALIAMLACIASAGSVSERLGPYNISFDLNTTSKYTIIADKPSTGVTENKIKFVDYNLSVDGGESIAYIVIRGYRINNLTDIDSNKTSLNIVTGLMSTIMSRIDRSKILGARLYSPITIDGRTGVMEACRLSSDKEFVCASYFLEDDASSIKKTNCRIFSTFPWEVTREMLYSLHVAGPSPPEG
jgi:hypothetical protein